MQCSRVEVRAVRPDQGVDFGVYADLIEQFSFLQRPVEVTFQNRPKVYCLLRLIIEPYAQGVRADDLDRFDAVNRMAHR